jgi:hypothetical protein
MIELEGLESSLPKYVQLNDGKTTMIYASDETAVIPPTYNIPINPNNNEIPSASTPAYLNWNWDWDWKGDGGSQPGGLRLTTEEDSNGSSQTKVVSNNDVESLPSDDLITLLGGAAGKKNQGEGPKLAADGVDKLAETKESSDKNSTAKSSDQKNSNGLGNKQSGHGGMPTGQEEEQGDSISFYLLKKDNPNQATDSVQKYNTKTKEFGPYKAVKK